MTVWKGVQVMAHGGVVLGQPPSLQNRVAAAVYRERYDLQKEYFVISPQKFEQLVDGRISTADGLLEGGRKSRVDSVSTILTCYDGKLYQYSVLSHGLGRMREIAMFGSVGDTPLHCTDMCIIRNRGEAEWMVNNWNIPGFLSEFSSKQEWNDGRIIKGFIPKVGGIFTGVVTAGYLIRQKSDHTVKISRLGLDMETYGDFLSELGYSENRIGVIRQYLAEG